MKFFSKVYQWAIKDGLTFTFLLSIFIILTAVFNILDLIVQGPVGLTPTVVSLLITLFIWVGLSQTN